MDTSVINAQKITTNHGLVIGKETASIKMIEFVNVRCPFCKKWFEESYDLLEEYVRIGKLQRIIKFFDKEKESLQRGNVMHHYIDYHSPETALATLKKIYDTQEQWGNLSLTEVATFAENHLYLSEKREPTTIQAVIEEANVANIKFVPTIIVDDYIFDESIAISELHRLLEK